MGYYENKMWKKNTHSSASIQILSYRNCGYITALLGGEISKKQFACSNDFKVAREFRYTFDALIVVILLFTHVEYLNNLKTLSIAH